MRFLQYTFLVLFFCLLSSCALVKTAYNNAPQMLGWWLDDYFDFTQSQRKVLDPALQQLHDWHRQNQLLDYVENLKTLQIAINKPQITPAEICENAEIFNTSLKELQQKSIPIIIEMAPLLTEKQLQYFQTKLDKRAQKWKSEWWQESPEAQIEARLEKTQDFAEKFYGDLNDSQQTLLKQKLASTDIQPALSYAEILRRNQDAYQVVSALQNQSLNAQNKTQLVNDAFNRLHKSPNANYQMYADQAKQRTCQIAADLHATTSVKQKQHANDWLENYIVQFSNLFKLK